ncbi:PTS sugar transporter subunit IIA [Vibrio toranzoniae]|uniref:PTS sugar transporter subunit IIA n=1 Tax=Vibrio toranzoniae TaxID=1194427 RepID=UPI001377B936|nr:PTS sugar transporter subunit IIA [Vibrio toranzoniae]NAZ94375.1 PTS transporter subunit EIIA [Vibrio toranzoniae]
MMLSYERVFKIKDEITDVELLKKLALSLFNDGLVKETFVQAVVDREADYPTAIDIGTHSIAIPHTEFEHVIETGVAIAVLPNATVSFKSADDPDITLNPSIVVMMALSPSTEKVEVIQKIFSYLGEYNNIKVICESDSNEKMLKQLKQIFP